jgi:nucleotide-binding universal stress UspA family protein
MSVPAVRRIVVGVDGSAESAAALRWACREAALRSAEVHAVHVREANCHSLASYAVPASPSAEDGIEEIWRSAQAEHGSVQICTEVVDGLAARVLLDRCAGAEMLVLGTVSDVTRASRCRSASARPWARQCPPASSPQATSTSTSTRSAPAPRAPRARRGSRPAAGGRTVSQA